MPKTKGNHAQAQEGNPTGMLQAGHQLFLWFPENHFHHVLSVVQCLDRTEIAIKASKCSLIFQKG